MPKKKPKGERPKLRGLERLVHRYLEASRETPVEVSKDLIIEALRHLAEPLSPDASKEEAEKREAARTLALRAVANALGGGDEKWQLKLARWRGRPASSFAAESAALDRDCKIYAQFRALQENGRSKKGAIQDLAVEHDLSEEWIKRIVEDIGYTPPERTIVFRPD